MKRSIGADRFADNIVHRVGSDSVLKPWLIIISLLLPTAVGLILAGSCLYSDDGSYFDPDNRDALLKTLICGVFLLVCSTASFLLFTLVRRNGNHLKRDSDWMDALCLYTDEHGGDTSKMKRIAKSIKGIVTGPATALSATAMVLELMILIAFGVHLAITPPENGIVPTDDLILFAAPQLLIMMAQAVLTSGGTFGFPARHDLMQTEFTKEFSDESAKFGLRVKPMKQTVFNRKMLIHMTLVLITAGLYMYVYMFFACKDMNRHITDQWDYEDGLLRDIISFEGGTGIEQTES